MTNRLFAVHWTRTAASDLSGIVEFISNENPDAARDLLAKIIKSCRSLNTFPRRARIVPELRSFGITIYRELVVEKYRIQFRIKNKDVYVLSVLDSRRNLEDILLDRFLKE